MKIIKIDYKNPDQNVLKKVANIIDKGGITIVPGDAVYTIVGDPFDKKAFEKVIKLKKGRNKNKAFNLGLYSIEDIKKWGEFNPLIYKIQKKFPNAFFAFAVPKKKNLFPPYFNPKFKTVAFRIPFNKVTSTLSKFHRKPVIGTSANISELPDAHSLEELLDYFRGMFGKDFQPDLILDAGRLPNRKPSTVIEINKDHIKILRGGDIPEEKLREEIEKIKNEFL